MYLSNVVIFSEHNDEKALLETINNAIITHKHQWEKIEGSTDVRCTVCGVRAMCGRLSLKESEGE